VTLFPEQGFFCNQQGIHMTVIFDNERKPPENKPRPVNQSSDQHRRLVDTWSPTWGIPAEVGEFPMLDLWHDLKHRTLPTPVKKETRDLISEKSAMPEKDQLH